MLFTWITHIVLTSSFILQQVDCKEYLVETKGSDGTKAADVTNTDYQGPWLSRCSFLQYGNIFQKDIPGCGGWIDIKCKGGCISIHEVLYSCKEEAALNMEPSFEQQKIVEDLCKGKESCRVKPSNELLGTDRCPGKESKSMIMWIKYSCDGGKDNTRAHEPKCRTKTSTTTTPPVSGKVHSKYDFLYSLLKVCCIIRP